MPGMRLVLLRKPESDRGIEARRSGSPAFRRMRSGSPNARPHLAPGKGIASAHCFAYDGGPALKDPL